MRKKRSPTSRSCRLPDSEGGGYYQRFEDMTPEEMLANSSPLNARERRQWQRFKAKVRRRVNSSHGSPDQNQ